MRAVAGEVHMAGDELGVGAILGGGWLRTRHGEVAAALGCTRRCLLVAWLVGEWSGGAKQEAERRARWWRAEWREGMRRRRNGRELLHGVIHTLDKNRRRWFTTSIHWFDCTGVMAGGAVGMAVAPTRLNNPNEFQILANVLNSK
jgi:hypothetical protein